MAGVIDINVRHELVMPGAGEGSPHINSEGDPSVTNRDFSKVFNDLSRNLTDLNKNIKSISIGDEIGGKGFSKKISGGEADPSVTAVRENTRTINEQKQIQQDQNRLLRNLVKGGVFSYSGQLVSGAAGSYAAAQRYLYNSNPLNASDMLTQYDTSRYQSYGQTASGFFGMLPFIGASFGPAGAAIGGVAGALGGSLSSYYFNKLSSQEAFGNDIVKQSFLMSNATNLGYAPNAEPFGHGYVNSFYANQIKSGNPLVNLMYPAMTGAYPYYQEKNGLNNIATKASVLGYAFNVSPNQMPQLSGNLANIMRLTGSSTPAAQNSLLSQIAENQIKYGGDVVANTGQIASLIQNSSVRNSGDAIRMAYASQRYGGAYTSAAQSYFTSSPANQMAMQMLGSVFGVDVQGALSGDPNAIKAIHDKMRTGNLVTRQGLYSAIGPAAYSFEKNNNIPGVHDTSAENPFVHAMSSMPGALIESMGSKKSSLVDPATQQAMSMMMADVSNMQVSAQAVTIVNNAGVHNAAGQAEAYMIGPLAKKIRSAI